MVTKSSRSGKNRWVDTARQITIGATAAGIALSSFNMTADAAVLEAKAPIVNVASKPADIPVNKFEAYSQAGDFSIVGIPTNLDELSM